MTREEIKKAMRDTEKEAALKNLHKLFSLVEGHSEYVDCINYAIKALEQEPVIDKIRTEIEELDYIAFDGITKRRCLEIIDKYKTDEEQE